ncbi:hypothetical protein EYF80_008593 [Liparis tanakae]|uniref:Uncharacterized protein n=1 Tax=Liparis tanakae TaxID=230148 RepID=A0A4Z2ITC4_9TELE|nr:hypothetical protein EYF80_008593 [Liparis tanakae]
MRYKSRGCQVTEYRCLRTSRTDRLELDREASPFPADTGALQREGWKKTIANRQPSGEKADIKAPLDFTGWQGGARRDMGKSFPETKSPQSHIPEKQQETSHMHSLLWDEAIVTTLLSKGWSLGVLFLVRPDIMLISLIRLSSNRNTDSFSWRATQH